MPEITKEPLSETPEVEELPKPTFDEPSHESTSESVSAVAAQYEQRLKDTEEKLRREFQSKFDKDTASVRKTYGDLSELQKALAEAKAGGDPDKIYAAIEQRNLYAKVEELEKRLSAPQTASPGKSEQEEAYGKAVGLLKKHGLDNDPDVLKLMSGKYNSPTDFLFEVNDFVMQRNTKKPASPASAASPAGGKGVTRDAAAVSSEIAVLLSDRDALATQEGRAKLAEKRAELTELEGAS